MSNLFNEYQKICNKYDKLLDDYAKLLSIYKTTERQLYINNRNVIDSLKKIIRDDLEHPECVRETHYFCPYIKDYCLYIGGEFCKNVCSEKNKFIRSS